MQVYTELMKFKLIEKRNEVPNVTSFIFQPEAPVQWQAGQYIHYMLPHESVDDRGAERWFTVASAPYETTPMITTRHASEHGSSFKEKLFSLEAGDNVEAGMPEGDFVLEATDRAYVFIAGGIGITPFHSILKQADHDGTKLNVTLLYGNRDKQAPYKAELEAFAERNPNLKIQYILSPQVIDEAVVRQYVPDLSAPLFYLSGPEPMVKGLAQTLESMGVAPERIKLDDFPGYEAHQG